MKPNYETRFYKRIKEIISANDQPVTKRGFCGFFQIVNACPVKKNKAMAAAAIRGARNNVRACKELGWGHHQAAAIWLSRASYHRQLAMRAAAPPILIERRKKGGEA